MAEDALDPGPEGTFPHWPRKPDGTWDEERMPTGQRPHRSRKSGKRVVIDQTPRDPLTGEPIVPPDLEPPN